MQTRPRSRFICLGAVLAVLLCLAALAVVQPSARAATPKVDFPITITNNGFSPCAPTLATTTLNLNPGDTLTFTNQTNQSVTINFTFDNHGIITKQSITVGAGKTTVFTPPANENFTYSNNFSQNNSCTGSVSEAIPQTPTPGVPGVPPSGGGPVAPASAQPSWTLWGALLTALGVVGLGGTLVVRRRWFR